MRRIGFVAGADATLIPGLFSGFLKGMSDLGYTEGKDFVMEWRFAEGNYDRFQDIADELVRQKVDIFVLATPAAVSSVLKATHTIPIVMGYSVDPVGNGFVESLSHPGGQRHRSFEHSR
jgi:putative tryptophan/tyrosine transport system substrate-binding protein